MTSLLRSLPATGAVAVLGLLSGCGSSEGDLAAVHRVKAGDHACTVEDTSLSAGRHTFRIDNVGSDVTEVYVYGKDGDDFNRIVGERENIGPGTQQSLEVDLAAGDYQVACKPGMTGEGLRTAITVTGSGGSTEAVKESYDRELEIEVARDGSVKRPGSLEAKVGERIEFKLENSSSHEHYLELVSPEGTELGEGEAHAGDDAEFVRELARSGDYRLKVFRDGHDDDATVLTLSVGR